MTIHRAGYWEDRLRGHFNEQGVGDIGLSRSYNKWLYAVRRRVFRRMASRLPVMPEQAKVLDIGSGTGFYIREWLAWGAQSVRGIDITDTAVERLKVDYPDCSFIRADIGEADPQFAPPASQDVVSAFDVMFHIVEDAHYRQAIENVAGLLKPGGYFVYSDNLVSDEVRMPHYVSRTEEHIVDTLGEAGMVVRHRLPVFALMNDPVRTSSRILRRWFALVHKLAGRGETSGQILGGALYPVELAVTRLLSRGPSTEILICQRRQARQRDAT